MKLQEVLHIATAGIIYSYNVNEDLLSAKLLLFADLRKLTNTKKILDVWSQNNKIFMKAHDGSLKKNVLSISDIGLS